MPASCSHFRRCLQVFAVLQWVSSFLALVQVCLAVLLLALLGQAWTPAVFYLVWLYGDRDTPQARGRQSAWVRNWAIWRHFRNYFPISATFPGLCPHLLMLPCWVHLPLFRNYIMCSGLVSSAQASAAYLLSRPGGGQVAVLAVEGPLEELEAKPRAPSLRIRNQKGFVKLVLGDRASLVPVFSFGENELSQQFPEPARLLGAEGSGSTAPGAERGPAAVPRPPGPPPALPHASLHVAESPAQSGAGGCAARAVRGEARGAVRRAQGATGSRPTGTWSSHRRAAAASHFLLEVSVTREGGIGIKGGNRPSMFVCLCTAGELCARTPPPSPAPPPSPPGGSSGSGLDTPGDLQTDPGHASRACSAALELRLRRGPSTRALQHLPSPFLTVVASPPLYSPSLFPCPAASPGPQTLEAQRSASEQLQDVLFQGSPHPRLHPAHTRISGDPKGSTPRQESLPRHLREPSSFVPWVLENCWQRAATGTGVFTFLRPSCTMKSRKKQWLEAMSVYHFVLSFLFLGLSSTILLFYLLFTSLWTISVLYFTWFFLDWDTPNQGRRRFQWVRNWTIWKHLRDYHSVKLVKTVELPPDRNYVFGSHPHGIMCIGTFCNFATEGNGFSRQFPGLRPTIAVLNLLLHLPVYRDYLLFFGVCSVNRHNLDLVLSRSQHGQAVVIMVGGAQESLYAVPGKHHIVLQNRKGFVHLALRHGASLVPVYSFGENDIFKHKVFAQDSWQYLCQITFKKIMGIFPCLFWGRSFFFPNSIGLLPFPMPITTVVGRPIPVPQCLHPTEEEVDHYHKLYMKALQQMFEEHKESCGVPASTHLTFI